MGLSTHCGGSEQKPNASPPPTRSNPLRFSTPSSTVLLRLLLRVSHLQVDRVMVQCGPSHSMPGHPHRLHAFVVFFILMLCLYMLFVLWFLVYMLRAPCVLFFCGFVLYAFLLIHLASCVVVTFCCMYMYARVVFDACVLMCVVCVLRHSCCC